MPDLLVVTSDHKLRTQIEDIVQPKGFRIKTALDAATALGWISSWSFDVAAIGPEILVTDQERIADSLWKGNPIAPFIVVDLDDITTQRFEQRLFGADLVRGAGGLKALAQLLDQVRPRTAMAIEGFSIMVVDDLDSPRDIICAFVESMGFGKVTGERSVKEALAKLIENPAGFSCIITDIRMPELSGEYLIEQVRRHSKLQHLPIIVLTAYGSADTLIACLNAGASGFLVKPPKRADLARELGRAYRIATRMASPRLASPDEVEQIRVALEQKGFS